MFQPWGDVLLYPLLLISDAQDTFQLVQVVVGGGSHYLGFGLRGEGQHVGEEPLAVFHRQIVKGAVTTAIPFKMLVGGIPVPEIVIVRHFGTEILQETLLSPVAVKETVFLIDYGFGSAAFDKFRIAEHGLVELRLELVRGIGIDVYTEILPSCRLACLRVSHGRIEVKIQRQLPVLDRSLPDCHFRTNICHIGYVFNCCLIHFPVLSWLSCLRSYVPLSSGLRPSRL